MLTKPQLFLMTVAASGFLVSCAATRFDVSEQNGYPSIRGIVDRITCEMVEMIKHDNFDEYGFKTLLVSGDYVASMKLSLQATESGQLAPQFLFPSVGTNLSVSAGFLVNKARTHVFSRDMRFAFKELHDRLMADEEFGECPSGPNKNLAGELGIKDIVRLQHTARSSLTSGPSGKSDAFSGTIKFDIKRNVSGLGPTWRLTNFVGPGGLAKFERSSTNTLVIGFAPGSVPADRSDKSTAADFLRADEVLRDEIVSQIR